MISCLCRLYTRKETFPCRINELPGLRADLSHSMSSGGVRMISLIDQACVQAHNVTFLQDAVLAGNPVHHLVVDGYADAGRISVIMQEIRNASHLTDQLVAPHVDCLGGNTRPDKLLQFPVNYTQKAAGLPDQLNLLFTLDNDTHTRAYSKIAVIAANTSFISTVPSTVLSTPFSV
ncbi:hypothetical protein IMSAG185_00327 [Lachnospiraceae bacterium]|nr:hypothetical protein IMSAG185_00327 [Lachnospiraceae bacterium]